MTSIGALAAATEQSLPEQAPALKVQLTKRLQPSVRSWIAQEARKIAAQPQATEATVRSDLQARFAGQSLETADIDALLYLVMMEEAEAMDKDLKAAMAEMKAHNAAKQKSRESISMTKREGLATVEPKPTPQARLGAIAATKGDLDSMNEMSEMTSLRMQTMMDRRAKVIAALSNIMKKISTTQDTLVQNLK